MAAAGLTALGSGGDTLRNIVVCPCSAGGTSDTPDLLHLAHAIAHVLGEYERLFALPRKFKISLSCPDACARPFSHDLGFVAQRRDDQWGLKVIGAGSLGAKPQTGIVLFDWLAPGEAPALALAAVKLFERLGDRQNRGKARLRHVRQRLGDDAFLRQLQQEFDVASQDRQWPAVTLRCPPEACEAKRPLAFANGDVSPAAADALAELAGTSGLSVRIGNDHRVMLFSRDASAAQQELHKHPALATAGRAQPNVIACPGTRWCARALADTNALAGRIRALLADRPEAGGLIAISGCPNGCVFSGIADIGIIGGKSTVDGHVAEKYTLSTGGGQGRDAALARVVVTGLSAEEVCEKVLAVVSA
jgi:sulfite reductase beta subunit-like hemoprotein